MVASVLVRNQPGDMSRQDSLKISDWYSYPHGTFVCGCEVRLYGTQGISDWAILVLVCLELNWRSENASMSVGLPLNY